MDEAVEGWGAADILQLVLSTEDGVSVRPGWYNGALGSKWAHKMVKKPVINVDADEEAVGETPPSLATDIVISVFTLWNAANVLVMESASIWGTFI